MNILPVRCFSCNFHFLGPVLTQVRSSFAEARLRFCKALWVAGIVVKWGNWSVSNLHTDAYACCALRLYCHSRLQTKYWTSLWVCCAPRDLCLLRFRRFCFGKNWLRLKWDYFIMTPARTSTAGGIDLTLKSTQWNQVLTHVYTLALCRSWFDVVELDLSMWWVVHV